jgi:hypothetical protein
MNEADEQEIYDSTLEQTENAPEKPANADMPAQASRDRDEKGRFKSADSEETSQEVQEPEPQLEAEKPTPEPEHEAKVPSWRLAEEAERRRNAEQALQDIRNELRQMQMQRQQPQQPQPQPEPVDIFADPQGFVQNLQGTFENRLRAVQMENSLRFARYANPDLFDKAYQTFIEQAPGDTASYQRVIQSGDPGETLVQWFKEKELHRELGGTDLKSFLDKQREEWLKDPAVQAKVIEAFKATQQAQPTNKLTNLPPSLSKATAASSAHEDMISSGSDMYSYATAPRKRS